MLELDLKFTLADNDLPKVTRMCDVAGIDVTFPLLQEEVVDFSLGLPADLTLRGTRLRYFHKEALRDLLPPEIIAKQKLGFALPSGLWLRDYAPLRRLAQDALDMLRARRVICDELIDGRLGTLLSEYANYYGRLTWVLMMLELWLQRHLPAYQV